MSEREWNRLKLGTLIGTLIGLPILVLNKFFNLVVSPFSLLIFDFIGNDPIRLGAGFIGIVLTLYLLGLLGDLLSLERFAGPILEKSRTIRFIKTVKEQGRPEVRIPEPRVEGMYKKAILGEKRKAEDLGEWEYGAVEVRGLSLGPPTWWILESELDNYLTGRSGWQTIKDQMFMGIMFGKGAEMIPDDIEN